MNILRSTLMSAMSIAVVSMAAGTGNALADEVKVMLGGDKEVPPVTTMAKGAGTITVMDDKSVRGMITTSGLTGTMAHIHLGAVGVNGPVIIPLTKSGDGKWMVPDGATLTDEQYRAYQAGELYINVHTAEHKGGEIRGQLK